MANLECSEEIPNPGIGGPGLKHRYIDLKERLKGVERVKIDSSDNVGDNINRIMQSTSETLNRVMKSSHLPIVGPAPLRFPSMSFRGFAPI